MNNRRLDLQLGNGCRSAGCITEVVNIAGHWTGRSRLTQCHVHLNSFDRHVWSKWIPCSSVLLDNRLPVGCLFTWWPQCDV